MAARMILMTGKNATIPLQLTRLIKDKTVMRTFPAVAEPSAVFCGGILNTEHVGIKGAEGWSDHGLRDGFFTGGLEKGFNNGGGVVDLEFFRGKSNGVEVRGVRRVVSDEDESDDDIDALDADEDIDDHWGKDSDFDDSEEEEEQEEEEEKLIRRPKRK